MKPTLFDLRALFPNHFSRRDDSPRDWKTLELPRVRVVGPLWSIVVQASESGGRFGITPLSERQWNETVPLNDSQPATVHPAMAFAMRPAGIWNDRDTGFQNNPDDAAAGNSRLSLVSVAGFVAGGSNTLALPFVDNSGNSNGSSLSGDQGEILLQPLGRLPAHVDQRKFLTAMRLSGGMIGTTARAGYMDILRDALGLAAPEDHGDGLYFLPTGVGFRAKVALPWRPDTVELWMQMTLADGRTDRGTLRAWRGPNGGPWPDTLTHALNTLEKRLAARPADGPNWLSFEITRTFGPEMLRWPTEPREGSILQSRSGIDARIAGDALQVRLSAEGRGFGADQLTLLLPELGVSGAPTALRLTSQKGLEPGGAGLRAAYHFARSDKTPRKELLELGEAVNGNDTAVTDTHLVFPALGTAQRLSNALGLPPPRDPCLIWVFTPLSQGWLHWPLPNATTENTYSLKPYDELPPEGTLTAGRLQMTAVSEGSGADALPWRLTVSRARKVRLQAEFTDNGISTASVILDDAALAVDDILPVTPFRQTAGRLLPDAADRVVTTFGLTAVTRNQLSQLEARLLQAGLSTGLKIGHLSIEAQAEGHAVISTEVTSELVVTLPPATGQDTAQTWHGLAETMTPWAWIRHQSLPMVQAVALGETGAAEARPSSTRDLAPLILKGRNSDGAALSVKFKTLNDAASGVPRLATRPDGNPLKAERPTAGGAWLDEAGMVPTTMSSVMVMPGAKDLPGIALPDRFWAGFETPTQLVLRHDIPATDTLWTQVKLPPPKAGSQEEAKPTLGFNPQPDNGPGDIKDPDNAWRGVWAARGRALALAALDRRDMLARDVDCGLIAPNLFGDLAPAVTNVTFSSDIVFDPDGTIEPSLIRIGNVSLTLEGAAGLDGPRALTFAGLPAVTDLEGVAGRFQRACDRTGALRLGTLRTPAADTDNPHIMDQLGLIARGVEQQGSFLSRRIERYIAGETEPKTWDLVSLKDFAEFGPLRLFFLDVPFTEGSEEADLSESWRKKDGSWADTAAAQAGFEHNHLSGFSWSVRGINLDEGEGGLIEVHGWHVAPRALLRVERDGASLKAAEIACQVHVRTGGSEHEGFMPTDGEMVLRLADNQVTVLRADLRIPLDDPARAQGVVPVLQLTKTEDHTQSKGKLSFLLGGESVSLPVYLRRDEHYEHYKELSASGNVGGNQNGALRMRTLAARFDCVPLPSAPNKPMATMTLEGKTEISGLAITLEIEVDLFNGTVNDGTVTLDLFGTTLKAQVTPTSRFDGTTLALDFTLGSAGQHLFGLPVTGLHGTLLAATGRPEVTETGLKFAIAARQMVFFVKLKDSKTALRLTGNTLDHPGEIILDGWLSATSLFSWPGMVIDGETATWKPGATAIPSAATARFPHTRVPIAHEAGAPVSPEAEVTHQLGDLTFRLRQTVALYGAGSLRALVEQIKDSASAIVPSALPGQTHPTHFQKSGLVALPSGIGPDLAAALTKALDQHGPALGAVDMAGHHWLSGGQGGARRIALPFLSVWGLDSDYPIIADPVIAPNTDMAFDIPGLSAMMPGARMSHRDKPDSDQTPGRFVFVPQARSAGAAPLPEQCLRAEVGATIARLANDTFDPTALSLSRDGAVRHGARPDGKTNPWEQTADQYEAQTYATMWSVLDDLTAPQLHALLGLHDPAAVQAAPRETELRLRVYAVSATEPGVDLLGQRNVSRMIGPDSFTAATFSDWARALLIRVAPEARHGLIVIDSPANGEETVAASQIIDPKTRSDRPTATLDRDFACSEPQGQFKPQLVPFEQDRPEASGYATRAIAPVAATSDMPHLDGIGQTGNRLTASGLGRSFTLANQSGRVLSEDAWILSRDQVAFRRAEPDDQTGGKGLLRPSSPPESRAALSPVSVPTSQGRVRTGGPILAEGARAFVPPYIEETSLGGRPGAWTVLRYSIEAGQNGNHGSGVAASVQAPSWVRMPRPLELGRHDRPRASSHERGHMALDWQPTAIVHGPAAPVSAGHPGLDRRPRSAWARTLTLTHPSGGIPGPAWDGTLVLETRDLTPGSQDPDAADDDARILKVLAASIIGPDISLRWSPGTDDVGKRACLSPGVPLKLGPFLRTADELTEMAAEVIARLPAAQPLTLVLQVSAGGLSRLVRLEMLTGSAGRGLPERPLYLRFDDPAYNDRLTGLANLNRENGPGADEELVFAADAREIRTADFVTFAFGIRATGATTPTPFDASPILTLSRERPGDAGAERLKLVDRDDATLAIVVPPEDPSTAFASVLLADIVKANGAAGQPALFPGDILIAQAEWKSHLVKLRFDVVEQPSLPENAVFFGLHRLTWNPAERKQAAAAISVSGFGLPPATVEVVDPAEMLRGTVRRRAMYQWRTFEPPAAPTGLQRRFALQKRTRTGATWLPAALHAQWLVPGALSAFSLTESQPEDDLAGAVPIDAAPEILE